MLLMTFLKEGGGGGGLHAYYKTVILFHVHITHTCTNTPMLLYTLWPLYVWYWTSKTSVCRAQALLY